MSIEQAVLALADHGELSIERLEGVEAMNAVPLFEVTVQSDDPNLALDTLLGASAMVALGDEDGAVRRIPLVVAEASYAGVVGDRHRYAFRLTSPLALLSHRRGYRTYLDESAKGIVSDVLERAGIGGDGVQWRLSEQLYERPQCVQYDESDWDFARRLLADEGIAFWHESDGEAPVLVLGDGPASHDAAGGGPFGFDDASSLRGTTSAFFRFERAYTQVPTASHLREYDVRQPDVLIEGAEGEGFFEQYEYPAWTAEAAAAKVRARVRLEQHQREADVTTAATHSVRLVPGRVITVEPMPDAFLDGEYLVTEVRHRVTQRSGQQPYVAECRLVPHGERTHRPAVCAPPRVDGVESATVTGPGGEEIHVDDLGRIKLQTRWDTSGKSDDTTSAWARTTQMNMDGSMLLPRMGFPMAIAYRDGRPDMPVALGKLYNGAHRPPYSLPAEKATASLMSGTTPGGGSVNEIKLSDDAGKQAFGVQASGDQGVAVGGDASITVAVDEDHNIQGNLTEHVKGVHAVSVGGNQTITAGAVHATKVGVRVVTVGGSETTGADLNRIVDCGGGYTESIGGLSFTQCNTAIDTCKASYSLAVGGAVAVAAGCGTAESVLGARTEVCGGPRLVAAASFEDKVYGAKAIQCGVNALTAGTKIVHDVKAGAVIQAGATTFTAGAAVEIVAKGAVNITAAALSASGGSSYRIAGVHSASADVNLDNSTAKMKITKANG